MLKLQKMLKQIFTKTFKCVFINWNDEMKKYLIEMNSDSRTVAINGLSKWKTKHKDKLCKLDSAQDKAGQLSAVAVITKPDGDRL